MELAEGGSLLERLDREGPLPLAEAASSGLQLLSALAAAHAEGIVHRDVKPHDVLLDRAGRAGWARARASQASTSQPAACISRLTGCSCLP
jgi:serine/threonine protein kinase